MVQICTYVEYGPTHSILQCILKTALLVHMLGNMLTILGTLLKCFRLSCIRHKCQRSGFFKMDENIAFCDISAEKLTLG
jgi:hypothetical protein